MSHASVGIRSLALAVPRGVRTNEFWRRRHPEMIAECERRSLSRVFSPTDAGPPTRVFDEEMEPYLADPFRGAVARRLLAPGETTLGLEVRAARDAIRAADLAVEDVDLLICCSFLPDQFGPGNAAFVCREVGLGGTAWNLESTCSSAFHALHTATALVRAGEYRNVLVVVSCTYSRFVDERTTLAWNSGDAAGAFVVAGLAAGEGVLGATSIHTADTCGAFWTDAVAGRDGEIGLRMRAAPDAGRMLRESCERSIVACCGRAAERAGVDLAEIDFFVFPTPVPWLTRVCARALGVDPDRTISTHADYSNVGPALPLVNLYHAAREGRVRRGDLVLLATIGSVSSAGAAVMRWGEAGLGPEPDLAGGVALD